MGTKPCDFFTSVKFCGQTGNFGRESRDEGKVKGKLQKGIHQLGSVSCTDSADAGRFPEYWCFRIQVAVSGRPGKGRSIKLHNYPQVSSHNCFNNSFTSICRFCFAMDAWQQRLTSPLHFQCYWNRWKSEVEIPCNSWDLRVAFLKWDASTAWREL